MAKSPFAIPKLPKLPSLQSVPTGGTKPSKAQKERRKRKRVSVDDLNRIGVKGLDLQPGDLKTPDRRSAFTRLMDAIDVPRNIVGNIIGSMTGVDKGEARKGALGMKVVTTSDILEKLGVKNNVVKAIGGFVGDVAMDPLTYLSLGASTGLSVGKHVPKVLKPGVKLAKAAAKAASQGEATSPVLRQLAKAIGVSPQRAVKWASAAGKATRATRPGIMGTGPEAAAKYLANKRGGAFMRRLAKMTVHPTKAKPARAFLTQFGEKGRTILRAPFAASGLTAKVGRKADIYKAMAAGTDETLKKVGTIKQTLGKARTQSAKITAYRQAAAKAKALGRAKGQAEAAGELQEADKLRKLYDVAKVERNAAKMAVDGKTSHAALKEAKGAVELAGRDLQLAKTSPEASAPFRALHEAQVGKVYKTPQQLLADKAGPLQRLYHGAGRTKQAMFGHGASRFSRLAAGVRTKHGTGSYAAGSQTTQQIDDLLRPIADDVAKQTGQNADEIHRAMYNLMDVTGNQLPDDPIHAALKGDMAAAIKARPDFQAAATQIKAVTDKLRADLLKRGASIGEVDEYLKRLATPEFGAAQRAKQYTQPTGFNPARVKMERFQDTNLNKTIDVTTSPDHAAELKKLQTLAADETSPIQHVGQFDLSAEHFNTLIAGKLPGQKIVDPTFTGKQFAQNVPESVGATAADAVKHHAAFDLRDETLQHAVRATKDELATNPELRQYISFNNAFNGLKDTPAWQWFGKNMAERGLAVPVNVSEQMREIVKLSAKPDRFEDLLKITDKPLTLWKKVTLMHPAYTVRNIFNNSVQIITQGVSPMPALTVYKKPTWNAVGLAMEGKDAAAAGMVWGMRGDRFIALSREHNVVGGGLTSALLGEGAFNKAKNLLGRVSSKWFKFNSQIEDSMRAATFGHLMQQGMTPRQAAMKVIRAMPDLSDLTMFETKAMRRIFPWYSWLRKNGSNMLKLAAENPAIPAGTEKLKRTIEMLTVGDDKIEDDLRPDWMAEQQAIQFLGDRDKGTVFLMANWMPFQDMMDLFEVAQTPDEFFRSMLSKIRPDAKFIIESGAGQDIFRRRPIEPFTTTELLSGMPAALVGRSGTPLDSLMSVRPAREAVRTIKDMPDTKQRVLRTFIGGSLQPLTRQRALSMRYVKIKAELDKVRSAINRANQVSDNAEVEKLTKRWFELSKELDEAGLPGVAKKTKSTLRRLRVKSGT